MRSSYDVKTTSRDCATGCEAEWKIYKQNRCSIVFPLQHNLNRLNATPVLCVKGLSIMYMVSVQTVYAAPAGGWYDSHLGGLPRTGQTLEMWFYYTCPPLSLCLQSAGEFNQTVTCLKPVFFRDALIYQVGNNLYRHLNDQHITCFVFLYFGTVKIVTCFEYFVGSRPSRVNANLCAR